MKVRSPFNVIFVFLVRVDILHLYRNMETFGYGLRPKAVGFWSYGYGFGYGLKKDLRSIPDLHPQSILPNDTLFISRKVKKINFFIQYLDIITVMIQ